MLCGHVSPLALCFLFRRIKWFLLLSLSSHQILVVVPLARPSKLRCPDDLSRGWFRKKRERKRRLLVGDLGPSGGTLHTHMAIRIVNATPDPMSQKPLPLSKLLWHGPKAIYRSASENATYDHSGGEIDFFFSVWGFMYLISYSIKVQNFLQIPHPPFQVLKKSPECPRT